MAHMTTREVVEQQGVSHRTLMRMIEKREIVPTEKLAGVTGSYLFDEAEVERAFRERPEPSKGGRPRKTATADVTGVCTVCGSTWHDARRHEKGTAA